MACPWVRPDDQAAGATGQSFRTRANLCILFYVTADVLRVVKGPGVLSRMTRHSRPLRLKPPGQETAFQKHTAAPGWGVSLWV